MSEFTDAVSQQATATVGVIKDNTPLDAATAGGWMKSLVGTVNSVLQIVDTTEGEEKDEIPIVAEPRDTSPRVLCFEILVPVAPHFYWSTAPIGPHFY